MTVTSTDLLWGLYLDSVAHVRHYETQRTALLGVNMTIGAAVAAIAGWDHQITRGDWTLGLLLMIVGAFGLSFSAKQYERATVAALQATEYREALSRAFPDADILTLRSRALQKGAEKFRLLGYLRIHLLYGCAHLIVFVLGLLLLGSSRGWW